MIAAMNRPALAALALLAVAPLARAADQTGPGVPDFWVRLGYKVTLAAEAQSEARFLELDDRGTLYLSQPGAGKILALTDPDGDGLYDKKSEFVTGLPSVHGMHWVGSGAGGWLWFTTSGGVYKAQDADASGKADEVVAVLENLPEGGGHNLRSICVDGAGFFTSIGDSSNASPEEAEKTDRQKIWRYALDGSKRTLFASGIRNTLKLRLQPGTRALWGADHGSDDFGEPYGERSVTASGLSKQAITDLNPPEEFNRYVEGGFYGHPWVVGDRIPRLEFRDRPDIATLAAKTIPPAYKGGAHWANNGFTFASKDYFPDGKGDAYIGYHGSWNSETRVGYQVHRVFFDKETGRPYGGYAIVSTINQDDPTKTLGRPCDVVEAPDGTLLFSDTQGRKIFRISKE